VRPEGIRVEREIAGRKLVIETGKLAKQAAGAVVVTYGGTSVLVAVTAQPLRAGLDFFPLTVDYRERGYGAGLIFGGRFMKREGRPTEKEILTCRLTDRSIRPLFPMGYTEDILVQAIVLSSDGENDPDVAAMIGAYASLNVSPLPFSKPLGAVRMGFIDGAAVVNPTTEQLKESKLDLIVAASKDSITMVEAGAKEISEADVIEALARAQDACREIAGAVEELVGKVGVQKLEVAPPDKSAEEALRPLVLEKIKTACQTEGKEPRRLAIRAVRDEAFAGLIKPEDPAAPDERTMKKAFEKVEAEAMRAVTVAGRRIDGRAYDEVRAIWSEVGVLPPRTHGSAVFTRGETQALVVMTLGTPDDKQLAEGLHGEFSQRFLLHYNFPSFCVGEVKMPRGPGRREIGHGVLARRALEPVLPEEEVFPYTIRLVSEVLESNGSSSMATVCGGTLALMDTGVPISAPVAGIAMGLIKEGGQTIVLSDIIGAEDHFGDMDFKVAGTEQGITALQMDIKIDGVTSEEMKAALDQAKAGRKHILGEMLTTIAAPRENVPDHAPMIIQIRIDPKLLEVLVQVVEGFENPVIDR